MSPLDAYHLCERAWPHVGIEEWVVMRRDPMASLVFAKNVIKGPFPEGEKAIASSEDTALRYAQEILHGPFPQGERILAANPKYAFAYAQEVLNGPFPAGEAAIAQDAAYAYPYALHILKAPFPEGEPVIARDAFYGYCYALNVLKGRFPASEPHLARDSTHAYNYAMMILDGPFSIAEPILYERDIGGPLYLDTYHTWYREQNTSRELNPWVYLAFDLRWGEDCTLRMDAHAQRTGLSKDWIALAKTLIGAEMSLEQVVQLCRGSLVSHQPTGASSAIDFTA